jgi:uncharacterized protein YtpQ (UPF0354 family)
MRAFYDRALAALSRAYPDIEFRGEAHLFRITFKRREEKEDGAGVLNLENIYKVEREAAIARARGEESSADAVSDLLRSVRLVLQQKDGPTREDVLERSKPLLLRPSDYVEANLARHPLKSLTFEKAYAVDYDGGVTWIARGLLERFAIGEAELDAAALANLEKARGKGETQLGILGPEEGPPVLAILETRDGLASSRVFDRSLKADLEGLFAHGYRLSVPKRDLLLVFSAGKLDECSAAIQQVRTDFASAAHPLSPELHAPGEFVSREGKA